MDKNLDVNLVNDSKNVISQGLYLCSSNRATGFSLMELLMVMVMMSCLMGLVAPAVVNIGKSSTLNGDGAVLSGMISCARQNSLSKNTMTALVVATDPSSDVARRIFSILEFTPPVNGTQELEPADWKQISKWESLGVGIDISRGLGTPIANTTPVGFPSLSYKGATLEPLLAIVFMPDGSTYYSDGPTIIKLEEGYCKRGDGSVVTTSSNYYQLTVLNATGRTRIDRP